MTEHYGFKFSPIKDKPGVWEVISPEGCKTLAIAEDEADLRRQIEDLKFKRAVCRLSNYHV